MADNLTVETFTEYAIGMVFLLVRLFARLHTGGIRGLRLDDAFAIAATVFWSMLTAIIYLLGIYGSNIGLNAHTAMLVPESQVPDMVLGSKLAFMNWIWYLCYIWCLKGVLLYLYHKLTEGLWHRNLVWAATGFCAVTWLACLLSHICLCTPIHRNWQIKPYPGDNCTLRPPLYIVIAVLNVLSDLVVILVPIPILTKLQIPLQRKLVLILMFSSGFFIMVCTILRAYYSLRDITYLPIALGWADRECFVAAIVASLPGIKPLLRSTRWLGSAQSRTSRHPFYKSSGYNHFQSNGSGKTQTKIFSHRSRSNSRHFELESMVRGTEKASRLSSGESEEYILEGTKSGAAAVANSAPRDPENRDTLAIHVTSEYSLVTEQRAAGNCP